MKGRKQKYPRKGRKLGVVIVKMQKEANFSVNSLGLEKEVKGDYVGGYS